MNQKRSRLTPMLTHYWPSLSYLPILLIVGVFLIVPGGFIIIGAAIYCAAAPLTGVLAMAARRRRRLRATSRRPSPSRRATAPYSRRSGADVATPIAATLNTDQSAIR
jgi:hypothetical protein